MGAKNNFQDLSNSILTKYKQNKNSLIDELERKYNKNSKKTSEYCIDDEEFEKLQIKMLQQKTKKTKKN